MWKNHWKGIIVAIAASGCGGGTAASDAAIPPVDAPAPDAVRPDAGPPDAQSVDSPPPCPPETLATGYATPAGLAPQGGDVFWSEMYAEGGGGAVYGLDASGDAVLLHADGVRTNALAADATRLYWATDVTNGGVRAGTHDGTGTPITVSATASAVKDILVDDTALYWAQGIGSDTNPRQIVRVAKPGFSQTLLAVAGVNGNARVAMDETHIYWLQEEVAPGTESIQRVPKAGGPTAMVAGSLPLSLRLAVDDQYVYFTTHGATGGLHRVVKTGGTPEELVAAPFSYVVTVDDTRVYWGTNTRILSLPTSGAGSERVVSEAEASPVAIAVDDSYVYWTTLADGQNGALRRACK